MGSQSQHTTGGALLDELIRQLKERESIERMLNDLSAEDAAVLAGQLADELERAIRWRHMQHELLAKTAGAASDPPAADTPASRAPAPGIPASASSASPGRAPTGSAQVSPAPTAPAPRAAASPTPVSAPPVPGPPVSAAIASAAPEAPAIPEEKRLSAGRSEPRIEETEMPTQRQVPRVPIELGEGDYIYLHGVSRIQQGDSPSDYPFMLEEKGIDNRNFAFALDHRDLRFYGSVLNAESVNLTKTGVLLLGKLEKIRMRGAHESLLNDLRLHQMLLPFEFGTVARGSEELIGMIEGRFTEIHDALDELLATRWWNVTVYALDSRVAELIGPADPVARRENDRGRVPYSSPAFAKRIDVKTLERILNKQKKAAESIHEALQPYAQRFDIDLIVNLQSGSSDDWKIILKVSYELNPPALNQFVRTMTELQYQHFLMELMLSLTGNVESFSFSKDPPL